MDISLIHAGLAAGAALAVVPLILHLIMRQTPKRVIFPALRLLQQRHKRSTKRLRIKNWLLLLARMALVALMALALARPALNARVPLGDREVPTALALVVDTSLSMGYVDRGKTRLDAAKEVAGEILRRLPESSQVYLIDSAVPAVPAPVSPVGGPEAAGRAGAAGGAAGRSNDGDRAGLRGPRREPSRPAAARGLRPDRPGPLRLGPRPAIRPAATGSSEESGREVATYVIRLAPEEVSDAAVVAVEARPAAEAEADGRRALRGHGHGSATSGRPRPGSSSSSSTARSAASRSSTCRPTAEAEVTFRTPPNLEPGLHQAAGPARPGPTPCPPTTSASSPSRRQPGLRRPGRLRPRPRRAEAARSTPPSSPRPSTRSASGSPNRVETLATDQFGNGFPRELANFAAVFLNNVGRLPERLLGPARRLRPRGGGVVIGLGPNTDPANYTGEAARAVVPGTVGEPVTLAGAGTAFGDLVDPAHSALRRLRRRASPPTWRPGRSGPTGPSSRSTRRTSARLIRYQDGKPALVESIVNGPEVGRVLVWTTPLSRRPNPGDPDAWNEFPNPFGERLVVPRPDDADRPLPGRRRRDPAELRGRRGRHPAAGPGQSAPAATSSRGPAEDLTERINPPREASRLVVEGPEALGHWTVTRRRRRLDQGRPAARLQRQPQAGGGRLPGDPEGGARRAPRRPRRLRPGRLARRDRAGPEDGAGRPRGLPLADRPDPPAADRRELPGQPLPPRGGPRRRRAGDRRRLSRERRRPMSERISLSLSPIGHWALVLLAAWRSSR